MQVTKLSGFLLATDVTRYGYPKDLVSGNTQQQHKNQGLCTHPKKLGQPCRSRHSACCRSASTASTGLPCGAGAPTLTRSYHLP